MFSLTTFAAFALAASSVSAHPIPRATPPQGWAFGYLEDYDTYHTRYLAVGCQNNHGTQFFDDCCHPMLATETLEKNRKPECKPSPAAESSAPADDDEEECDDVVDDCDDEDQQDQVTTASQEQATTAPQEQATTAPQEQATTAPQAAAPAPTTSQEEKPTTTEQAAPQPTNADTSSNNDQSGFITDGFATFYDQNGIAGACGDVHGDGDLIAAIDSRRYGNTGQKSDLCGKQVLIKNPKNNKSVTVTIADACPTCENSDSIDLSRGAFNQIATEAEGFVSIEWKFV